MATWAVLLGAAALVLGLLGGGRPSPWADEVATLVAVRRSFSELMDFLGQMDAVHGLWYLLVRVWVVPFGESIGAVHALSAVLAGFATAGVVVLGAVLAGRRLAVAAGFVMLVLPVVTGMAIEARSEALVTALATWTAVALTLALREGRVRWWVLYGCGVVVSALAFVQSLTLVAAHALVLLLVRPGAGVWRRFVLAIAGAVVVLVPFVVAAARQRAQIDWVAPPTVADVARIVGVHEWFSGHGLIAGVYWLAMAAVVLLPRRFPLAWRSSPVPVGVLALAWAVVPNLVVLVVSVVATPMFVPRYLAYTAPAIALLVGVLLASLRPVWATALAGVLAALGAWSVVQAWSVSSKDLSDWSTASVVAHSQSAVCDSVVFFPDDGASRSPRRALDAFPARFSALTDVGLVRHGADTRELFDSGREVAPTELEPGACAVGLVSLRGTTADAARQVLVRTGWSPEVVWAGPSTLVVRLGTEA